LYNACPVPSGSSGGILDKLELSWREASGLIDGCGVGRWNNSNDWNCDNAGIGGGKGVTFWSNKYNLIRFYDKEEDNCCILCEMLWIAKLHLK
jgi:hypothetical protein